MANNLYRIEVPLTATAYVKAASGEEAMRKLREELAHGAEIEVAELYADIPVSDAPLDDPCLPEISLSPSMTAHEPEADAEAEQVEVVEDNVAEEE